MDQAPQPRKYDKSVLLYIFIYKFSVWERQGFCNSGSTHKCVAVRTVVWQYAQVCGCTRAETSRLIGIGDRSCILFVQHFIQMSLDHQEHKVVCVHAVSV
jgi:hypothetical protein